MSTEINKVHEITDELERRARLIRDELVEKANNYYNGYVQGCEDLARAWRNELYGQESQGMQNPYGTGMFYTATAADALDVQTDTLITEEGSADNNSVASKNDSNDSDNKKAKNESGGQHEAGKPALT